MKRDDEYIRELLFEAEESNEPYQMAVLYMNMPPEELKRHQHFELMVDAGLFQAVNSGVYRMTNQGHDYLNAIRNDTVWEKTKAGASQLGGATLGIMKDIAISYLKQELSEKLGLPLS